VKRLRLFDKANLTVFKVIVCVGLLIISQGALGHSGRTDSRGGHFDHSNGTYHYHNSGVFYSGYYDLYQSLYKERKKECEPLVFEHLKQAFKKFGRLELLKEYQYEPISWLNEKLVLLKSNGKCLVCGSDWDVSVEYTINSAFGGELDRENLGAYCRACRGAKYEIVTKLIKELEMRFEQGKATR
jgi:hypothetical protein